jgi:two-component system sensor histidine kinase CiaH
MKASRKKHLATATVAYIFLLLYIVAALIWWFVSLQHQSDEMATLKLELLKETNANDPATYTAKAKEIENEKNRAHAKYIGEGITFLLLSLLGASFVYRSVRKQVRLQQQERNFMMAITHELKTPIAVSKLNLETLQKHKLDEAKQQKLIAMTLQETERLNSLTNNILVSSQLEGGRYNRAEEELDLSLLTASCVDDFRRRFPDMRWQEKIDLDIDITGDSLLLQILINNLLENAMKYSAKGGLIHTELSRDGKQAKLTIADNGIGIPNQEKKRIFGKFYRIGNEETRTTKGTGLGLYLCKKIADDHNASIEVSNNSPTGSTFTITFPDYLN